MEFVIYFSKLERCEVIIKARPTRVIRYLAIVALCLLLGFMLGRKSKYEKRDYLKQFKIGKATYSESLIYEAYGGLQNDGIMLAVYYDVDAAKIIHQLDSWEKINDSPTISSILKMCRHILDWILRFLKLQVEIFFFMIIVSIRNYARKPK